MSFDDAKKLYIKYNCSLFAMAREECELYDEYKKLNIKEDVERTWRCELYYNYEKKLVAEGKYTYFDRMYDLAYELKDKNIIFNLYENSKKITYSNFKEKLIVAETIMGRKELSAHSGLIFLSYDLGEMELSKEIIEYAIKLINMVQENEELEKRRIRDVETCKKIDKELFFGIFN